MNSKLIAIIAVVAMCGAALVGVGYAYQATLQTNDISISDNTADVKYITLMSTAQEETTITYSKVILDYNYDKVGAGDAAYALGAVAGATKDDAKSEAAGSGTAVYKVNASPSNKITITLGNIANSENTYTIYFKGLDVSTGITTSNAVTGVSFEYGASVGTVTDTTSEEKTAVGSDYTHKVVVSLTGNEGSAFFDLTLDLYYTIDESLDRAPVGITIDDASAKGTMSFLVKQNASTVA